MNKDKILGILISLLSILLVVVPILAAFSAHGWDPKAALLGSSNPLETQFENIQNLDTQNMFGNIEFEDLSSLSLNDLLSVLQGRPINITVQVNSPFSFPITIKNISGNLMCNDHNIILGNLHLTSEVEFSAHGSNVLSITCSINSSEALGDVVNHGGLPDNIGIEDASLKLDIYGIIIEGTFESL